MEKASAEEARIRKQGTTIQGKGEKGRKSSPFEWEINLEHRHESLVVWRCSKGGVAMFQEYMKTHLVAMFYLRGIWIWNPWRYSNLD